MVSASAPRAKSTPKVALTRQLPDGTIEALSSDGHTVYTVTLGEHPSCTCPATRACYHIQTALARYAPRLTCEHCEHSGADVAAFVNTWDNGSVIVLCTDRQACRQRQGW